MKLRHFKAERYRSLREFELDIDDFTVLLGENNCGKSNFFYALDLFLSTTAKGVSEDTFFNHDASEPIVLTARFDELTDGELDKLGPWTVDGSLTVSKEYARDESGKVAPEYYALMSVPKDAWLSEDFADYSNRDVVSSLPIAEFLPKTGRITKDAYRDAIAAFKQRHSDTIEYRIERRRNPADTRPYWTATCRNFIWFKRCARPRRKRRQPQLLFLGGC